MAHFFRPCSPSDFLNEESEKEEVRVRVLICSRRFDRMEIVAVLDGLPRRSTHYQGVDFRQVHRYRKNRECRIGASPPGGR